ncbi:hypothetical protein ND748_06365 [Frankia sp. AiPs1]|uniref:hypothetical protein n=1 Tax=Frankia sp. AiPs1 TaxID=573493 RepID=UPI0020441289|nr:hypothetical protein [Frankia sp. AiPs1]MCM3921299.1 hypothetical protein [Frankia sp. AiPs1]
MGLPAVSCAHTLVRMGGVGEEGNRARADRLCAAFLVSFLDAAALPPGMRRIRAPDVAAPPSGSRTVHQGQAIWLGAPDAELYRLDDTRWLLRSPRRAGELAGELLGPAATQPLAAAADDPRRAREDDDPRHAREGDNQQRAREEDSQQHAREGADPAVGGAGGAGPSTSGKGPRQVRLHVVRDTPSTEHVSVLQAGSVVARLRAVPGEGSALPDGLAAELGRLVAQRLTELAVAALELRRPGWHPARWIARPNR